MAGRLDWERQRQQYELQQQQMQQIAQQRDQVLNAQSMQQTAQAKAIPAALFQDPQVQQAALNFQTPGADAMSGRAGLASQQQDYALQRQDIGHEQAMEKLRLAAELREKSAVSADRRRGRGRKGSMEDKYFRLFEQVPSTKGTRDARTARLWSVWVKLPKAAQERIRKDGGAPEHYVSAAGSQNIQDIKGSEQFQRSQAEFQAAQAKGLSGVMQTQAEEQHRTGRTVTEGRVRLLDTYLKSNPAPTAAELEELIAKIGGAGPAAQPAVGPSQPPFPGARPAVIGTRKVWSNSERTHIEPRE